MNPDFQTASLAGGYTYVGVATYTLLQAKIFQNKCNSCHNATTPGGNLDMTDYADVFSDLTAGSSSGSVLYQQVRDNLMPKFSPRLSDAEKQAIADWIDAGALNN